MLMSLRGPPGAISLGRLSHNVVHWWIQIDWNLGGSDLELDRICEKDGYSVEAFPMHGGGDKL